MKKGVAKKATKSVKKGTAKSSTSSKSTVKKATKKKVSKKKKPARLDDSDSGCSGSPRTTENSTSTLLNITPPTTPINSDSALGVKIGGYTSSTKVIDIALQGTVPRGITIGSFGFRVTEETSLGVLVAEYSFTFNQLTPTTGQLGLSQTPQIPTDLKVTVLTKKKVSPRLTV
jgi:hypothetical protein